MAGRATPPSDRQADDAEATLPYILRVISAALDRIEPGLCDKYRKAPDDGARQRVIYQAQDIHSKAQTELKAVQRRFTAVQRFCLACPRLLPERFREERIQELREAVWLAEWWPLLAAVGVGKRQVGYHAQYAEDRRVEFEAGRQACEWVNERLKGDKATRLPEDCTSYEREVAKAVQKSCQVIFSPLHFRQLLWWNPAQYGLLELQMGQVFGATSPWHRAFWSSDLVALQDFITCAYRNPSLLSYPSNGIACSVHGLEQWQARVRAWEEELSLLAIANAKKDGAEVEQADEEDEQADEAASDSDDMRSLYTGKPSRPHLPADRMIFEVVRTSPNLLETLLWLYDDLMNEHQSYFLYHVRGQHDILGLILKACGFEKGNKHADGTGQCYTFSCADGTTRTIATGPVSIGALPGKDAHKRKAPIEYDAGTTHQGFVFRTLQEATV